MTLSPGGPEGYLGADDPLACLRRWSATSAVRNDGVWTAHVDSHARIELRSVPDFETAGPGVAPFLSHGATPARQAGRRRIEEEPHAGKTCFEVDRDRIWLSPAFRRLADRTQVFVGPPSVCGSRLGHTLAVAKLATVLTAALGLNVALAEAIAFGHDCGHGPGGHPGEAALAPYLPEGFDHAVWGAHESLASLNLCAETLDGIGNHSWRRPAPATPEGEVVSWADRIAYVCDDFQRALVLGLLSPHDVPQQVTALLGLAEPDAWPRFFVGAIFDAVLCTGRVGMTHEGAEALAALRAVMCERVYAHPSVMTQSLAVARVIRDLAAYEADVCSRVSDDPLRTAVARITALTDGEAWHRAVVDLGYNQAALPTVVDWAEPQPATTW